MLKNKIVKNQELHLTLNKCNWVALIVNKDSKESDLYKNCEGLIHQWWKLKNNQFIFPKMKK